MGWGLWGRLSRCGGRGSWADALCLHVGHQLVRDLGQHIPGQAGHAQHVVAGAVHIVPEGHKLGEAGKWGQDGAAGSPPGGPTAPNTPPREFHRRLYFGSLVPAIPSPETSNEQRGSKDAGKAGLNPAS